MKDAHNIPHSPTPHSALESTLKPDGQAIACKAIPSGFDSHRRLLDEIQARFDVAGPAARGTQCKPWVRRVPDMESSESEVRSPPVSSVVRAPDLSLAVAGSPPAPTPQAATLQTLRERSSKPEGGGPIV